MYYLITKPDCLWCDKAKQALDEEGSLYETCLYTDHPMLVKLMYEASMKTVPQIWYNGKHIGGYEDLVKWLANDT